MPRREAMIYALNETHDALRPILNALERPAPMQAEPAATPTPSLLAA